jgi:hypothetical protein
MLIHELGHISFMSNYKRMWSGSVEQECAATRFWAQVSSELGRLPAQLEAKWLGQDHNLDLLAEEIRRPSFWHRVALPTNQHFGLQDMIWAVWQALVSIAWVIAALQPKRLKRLVCHLTDKDPEPTGGADC